MNITDQTAAQRLAMCNDIGEAAYVDSLIAAALISMLCSLPGFEAITPRLEERYNVSTRVSRGFTLCNAASLQCVVLGRQVAHYPSALRHINLTLVCSCACWMQCKLEWWMQDLTGEDFVVALADSLFHGDTERAGQRLLKDYRSGALGWFALELPPDTAARI